MEILFSQKVEFYRYICLSLLIVGGRISPKFRFFPRKVHAIVVRGFVETFGRAGCTVQGERAGIFSRGHV